MAVFLGADRGDTGRLHSGSPDSDSITHGYVGADCHPIGNTDALSYSNCVAFAHSNTDPHSYSYLNPHT